MRAILIISLLITFSTNARNLLNDYGTDKYMYDMQMGDLKRVHNSIHEYERRTPAMSLGMRGSKSLLSIFNETTLEGKRDHHAYWGGFSLFADINDEQKIDNMFACYDEAVKLLDSKEVDKELDVSFSVAGLRKWQVYAEPRQLRHNRHKIYSVRRGIRAINRYLKKAQKMGNQGAISMLEELKGSILSKLDGLYGERDKLLVEHKDWRPRRYVWVNLNHHGGECFVEKAHDVVITPLDYVLEKLEAIKRKYSL